MKKSKVDEKMLVKDKAYKTQKEFNLYYKESQDLIGILYNKLENFLFSEFLRCDDLLLKIISLKKDNMRFKFRFINLKNSIDIFKNTELFINNRDAILSIEFHNNSKTNDYPLEKFIETGRNKITSYMVIPPELADGKLILTELIVQDYNRILILLKLILFYLENKNIKLINQIEIKDYNELLKGIILKLMQSILDIHKYEKSFNIEKNVILETKSGSNSIKSFIGDIEIVKLEEVYSNSLSHIEVKITNNSGQTWITSNEIPIFISYHIYDFSDNIIIYEGKRTEIPKPIKNGDSLLIKIDIDIPNIEGEYKIMPILVYEGKYWFEEIGLKANISKISIQGSKPIGQIELVDNNLSELAGEKKYISIIINNYSNEQWLTTGEHPIFLSYHWFKENGEVYIYDGIRTSIDTQITKNKSIQMDLKTIYPEEEGMYIFSPTIVYEGRYWMEDIGLQIPRIQVKVLKNDTINLSRHSKKIYNRLNIIKKQLSNNREVI